MSRELSTASQTFEPTPVVQVRGEKGQVFKGILKGHKERDSQYVDEEGNPRKQHIYEFSVLDSTMDIQVKEGKDYKSVDVQQGDTVAIFAPSRLNNALKQAKVEETIEITYLGLGKASGRGGRAHEYKVVVL